MSSHQASFGAAGSVGTAHSGTRTRSARYSTRRTGISPTGVAPSPSCLSARTPPCPSAARNTMPEAVSSRSSGWTIARMSVEQVAETFRFGRQVVVIDAIRREGVRLAAYDLDTALRECSQLIGVVGQQPDPVHPERLQHRRRN